MFGKVPFSRWLVAAAVLAAAETASVAAVEIAFVFPAQAQFFFGDQQYQNKRARPHSGGFFDNFFGPSNSRSGDDEYGPSPQQRQQHIEQPGDSSRAPPPRKADSKTERTTSIVVMGDGMADWLSYGLEDAFSDSPEIGIVRKIKPNSGLLQYDTKGDLDWWHAARDILAQEKADYVVMMLGLTDRQDIREKDLAKEAERKAKEQAKNEAEIKSGQNQANTDNKNQNTVPAPTNDKKANGVVEFRSEQWEKIYSRRIDETIAALKTKGVPVFWVGLPSIRGTRSTADAAYLNDFYRSRAERAGIVYIDLWDGFVDEAGKYSNYGPDYEGQTRRLRSSDGVFFTKYGALKLAHYVERELQRYMSNRTTVALPSGPVEPAPEEKHAARPLAGPTVPLTAAAQYSDDLLGAAGGIAPQGDTIAAKVLVKGEALAAPPGRADDFAWPLGSDVKTAQPVAAAETPAVAPPGRAPTAATGALASAPAAKKKEERKSGSGGKFTQKTTTKPAPPEATRPMPPRDDVPRPPLPIGPSSPFGATR